MDATAEQLAGLLRGQHAGGCAGRPLQQGVGSSLKALLLQHRQRRGELVQASVQVDACQSNASSDGAWQDLSPSEQEQLEPLPDGQQVMDLLQKHRERRAALNPPTVITPVSVVEAQLAFRTSVVSPQHLPQGCSYYQPSLSFPRSSLQMQDVLEPARPTVTTPASTQAAASRQPVDAPAGQGSGEQPTVVRMDPSRRAATVSSPDPLRVPSVEGGNQQAVQQQQQAGSAGRPAHSEQASSDGSHSSQAQHLDERMLLEHDRQSLGDSLEAGLDRQALSMPPQWQAPNQDWHAWQLRGVQRAQQAQGVLPLRQAVPRTSHHAACMECLRGQHAQACQHGMLGVQLDYVCNRCKARESKAHMSLPVLDREKIRQTVITQLMPLRRHSSDQQRGRPQITLRQQLQAAMRHSLDNYTPTINLALAASAPAPLAISIEDGRVVSMKDSDTDVFERPDRLQAAQKVGPALAGSSTLFTSTKAGSQQAGTDEQPRHTGQKPRHNAHERPPALSTIFSEANTSAVGEGNRVASQDLEQSSAAPSSAEQDDGAAGARGGLQAVAEADADMPQQRGRQGARSADTAWTPGLCQGPASAGMGPGASNRAPSEANLPLPAGAAQTAAVPGEQAPAPGSTAVAARARMARSLLSDAMKSAGSAGLSRAGSGLSHSSLGHSSGSLLHSSPHPLPPDERPSPASSTGQSVAAAQPQAAWYGSRRQPSGSASTGPAAASAQPPVAQHGLLRQLPSPDSASAVSLAPSSDDRQRKTQRGDTVSRSNILSGRRLSEGLHPAALRAAAAVAAFGDPSEVEAAPMAHQQAGCDIQQPAVHAPLEQSQASPDEAPRSLGARPRQRTYQELVQQYKDRLGSIGGPVSAEELQAFMGHRRRGPAGVQQSTSAQERQPMRLRRWSTGGPPPRPVSDPTKPAEEAAAGPSAHSTAFWDLTQVNPMASPPMAPEGRYGLSNSVTVGALDRGATDLIDSRPHPLITHLSRAPSFFHSSAQSWRRFASMQHLGDAALQSAAGLVTGQRPPGLPAAPFSRGSETGEAAMDNLMTTYGTSEMLPSRRSSCSDASSRPSTSLGGRPPAPPQPVSAPAAPLVVKPAVPARDLQPAGPPVPVHKPAEAPAVARRASEPCSPVKGADLMGREEVRRKSGEADMGLQFVVGQHRAAQKAKQELLLARNLQQAAVKRPPPARSSFERMSRERPISRRASNVSNISSNSVASGFTRGSGESGRSASSAGSHKLHHGYGYDEEADSWKVDITGSSSEKRRFTTYTSMNPEGGSEGGWIASAKLIFEEAAHASQGSSGFGNRDSYGMEALLDLLGSPVTSLEKQVSVLNTLAHLARDLGNGNAMCRYGGVELLMDLMHTTPSTEVLAAAVKALQALMASPEIQVVFQQMDGALAVAASIMKRREPAAQAALLQLLQASAAAMQLQAAGLSAQEMACEQGDPHTGGGQPLSPEHDNCRLEKVVLLADDDEAAPDAEDMISAALRQAAAQLPNEVFQVALQCLRTGEGRVAEAALDLMGCLVTGPGGVDPAMVNGLMSVLAFKLRQGCTGQLLGLLLQMVRGFAGHAQLLERFVQSDCFDALLDSSITHPAAGAVAPVQAAAALGALLHHAIIQQAAAAPACLKRVLDALSESCPDVLGGALYLLSCLARSAAVRQSIMSADVIPRLIRMLQRFPPEHARASATSLLRLLTQAPQQLAPALMHAPTALAGPSPTLLGLPVAAAQHTRSNSSGCDPLLSRASSAVVGSSVVGGAHAQGVSPQQLQNRGSPQSGLRSPGRTSPRHSCSRPSSTRQSMEQTESFDMIAREMKFRGGQLCGRNSNESVRKPLATKEALLVAARNSRAVANPEDIERVLDRFGKPQHAGRVHSMQRAQSF